jgi:cytochrome P450
MVMVCPMAVHVNPEFFEDPLKFNPWRWQVSVKQKQYLLSIRITIMNKIKKSKKHRTSPNGARY